MNAERDEAGLPAFANPRNASAGAIKRLDPKEAAKYPLRFIAHGLGAYEGPPLETETDFRNLLESVEIPPNSPSLTAHTLEELLEAVANIENARHHFDYGTDGAVIKIIDRSEREKLGTTSRAPRWAAAYKFLPEQKETTITEIRIQVGRTGVLTPVAELAPVLISGSTVGRATLHNQDEIDRKDIHEGDTVLIEKAGEIIPAIVRVISHQAGTRTYNIFKAVDGKCPSCEGPISQEEGFVAWRCTNFQCPAQAVTRISHFASRKALDIEGLGETVAEALVRHGYCHTPLDLFNLTEDTLGPLNLGTEESPRRFGEKNAAKVLTALQAARSKPLNRWLYAMGIRQLGESAAKELSRLHEKLTDIPESSLLRNILENSLLVAEMREVSPRNKQNPPAHKEAKLERKQRYQDLKSKLQSNEELLSAKNISPDLGPTTCLNVTEYFSSEAGKHVLNRLAELNINPTSENYHPKPKEADITSLPLTGKIIVITGSFITDRDKIKELIESKGGKVSGSVSAKTTYLLAGEGGGSKRDKAEKLDITVIDAKTFGSTFGLPIK
jgi:DNA ligase (NAD+)